MSDILTLPTVSELLKTCPKNITLANPEASSHHQHVNENPQQISSFTSNIRPPPVNYSTATLTDPYVKIIREDMIHRGFKYRLGINIDHRPFNPIGHCKFGGLYFCRRSHAPLFAAHGRLIVDVVLPPNENVHDEIDKQKAKCIVISNPRRWEDEFSEWEKQMAVINNPASIVFLSNPSLSVQKLAVTEDAHAIQFISRPSEEIQKVAIERDATSIEHIKRPSLSLQVFAITLNPQSIYYIRNPDERLSHFF